jgi:hypothetical protein
MKDPGPLNSAYSVFEKRPNIINSAVAPIGFVFNVLTHSENFLKNALSRNSASFFSASAARFICCGDISPKLVL